MNELTKLANKHNTDKGTVAYEAHGYTEEYAKYIPNTGKYKLLEIGVWHGDSIKMWAEYAPDMEIIGIDNDPNVLKYMNKSAWNYDVFIGDATDEKFLSKLLDDDNTSVLDIKLDFIIDDGSHVYEDILAAFKLLYPRMNSRGYYFIEDLHAGHSQRHRLMEDVKKWLYENDPMYIDLGLFCNDKLWIIQKV